MTSNQWPSLTMCCIGASIGLLRTNANDGARRLLIAAEGLHCMWLCSLVFAKLQQTLNSRFPGPPGPPVNHFFCGNSTFQNCSWAHHLQYQVTKDDFVAFNFFKLIFQDVNYRIIMIHTKFKFSLQVISKSARSLWVIWLGSRSMWQPCISGCFLKRMPACLQIWLGRMP